MFFRTGCLMLRPGSFWSDLPPGFPQPQRTPSRNGSNRSSPMVHPGECACDEFVRVTSAEKRKAPTSRGFSLTSGGASRSRTGLHGFAGRCITALLSRHKRTAETVATGCAYNGFADLFDGRSVHQTKREAWLPRMSGAGDESRTRDLNLGKVALYQLSYSRMVLLTTFCYCSTTCFHTTQNAASKIWSGRRVSNS